MKFFRSITGDIPAEKMGITFSHEHIVIEEGFPTLANPDFLLNDVEKISTELKGLKSLGCSTMVDTMPANAGRNVLKSVEISKKSGINIIIPTGIHLEIYYPPSHWRYSYNEDQLTDLFIQDIITGVDRFDYNGPIVERTSFKAGLIKLATGDDNFTSHQEKIFRSVVNAHLKTGAPILTHTNNGNKALEQAELFSKLGADLNHVVLSHLDRNKDIGYHEAVLQTGVNVEFDSAFRWKTPNENWTLFLLEKLLEKYPNQITVGMDAARNSYWRSYNGSPGLDYLLTIFPEELKIRGIDVFFNRIFVDNPKKIFCFVN